MSRSEKHDFAHDFMNKNKPKSQESQFMEAFKPVQMGKQNPTPVVPQAMVAISPNSLIRDLYCFLTFDIRLLNVLYIYNQLTFYHCFKLYYFKICLVCKLNS